MKLRCVSFEILLIKEIFRELYFRVIIFILERHKIRSISRIGSSRVSPHILFKTCGDYCPANDFDMLFWLERKNDMNTEEIVTESPFSSLFMFCVYVSTTTFNEIILILTCSVLTRWNDCKPQTLSMDIKVFANILSLGNFRIISNYPS